MLGVDAGGYTARYVWMIGAAAATFLTVATVLAFLQRSIEQRLPARASARLRRCVFLCGLFASFTLLLGIVARAERYDQLGGLRRLPELLAALGLGALVVLSTRAFARDLLTRSSARRALALALGHPAFLTPAVLVPGTLLLLCHALGRLPPAPAAAFALGAVLVLVGEVVLLERTLRRERSAARPAVVARVGRRLLLATAPWLLAPAALVAANELQYAAPGTSPLVIAAVLMGSIVVAGVALALGWPPVAHRLRALRSTRSLLAFVLFPAVVLSAATLCFHRHEIELDQLDLFHLGERTLPTQQLLSFGAVPLFDFMPTHTGSDMTYQSLYALLTGVYSGERGLDPLLWERWMKPVATLLLAYFFVARLVSPLFALFFALATPVLSVIPAYYAPALIPAVFLPWALRRPTVPRLVVLFGALAALGAWRVDFGVAGAVALAAVLLCARAASPRPPGRALVGALLWVGGAGAALLLLLALLAERSTSEALSLFLRSYTLRFANRTRETLASSYGVLAAWQYYLLPASAALVGLALAHRRLLRGAPGRTAHYLVGFVAIFALVMSVRSTERHTLDEAFNPYLFFAVLVFAPVFFGASVGARARGAARAIVLALLLLRIAFALPPVGFTAGFFERLHLLPEPARFQPRRWNGDEMRVHYRENRHLPLLELLRSLEADQTFFDFTNAPALYVLAGRRLPTYLIAGLAMSAEPIQKQVIEELEGWRAAGRLPLVVFRQGTFWDALDGVPTEVGGFRLAEWIYRHYRPFVGLDGFEVFREASLPPAPLPPRLEHRFAMPLRAPEGIHDARAGIDATGGSLSVEAGEPDPFVVDFADVSTLPLLSQERSWRIELEGESSVAGYLQVFWKFGDQAFAQERSAFVEVEAGTSATWSVELREPRGRLTGIRLDPPDGARVVVRGAAMIRSWSVPEPLEQAGIRQRFDLARLPWAWARFDPLHALERTRVVADLVEAPELVAPGMPLTVPLRDPASTLEAGYLELRMRWREPDDADPTARREAPGPREAAATRYLAVLYGPEPRSGFDLQVLAPAEVESSDGTATYLVRLDTQWRWATEGAEQLHLTATGPVEISAMRLRSGD
jgi:hypothetical protein